LLSLGSPAMTFVLALSTITVMPVSILARAEPRGHELGLGARALRLPCLRLSTRGTAPKVRAGDYVPTPEAA
jgi:hypothetical protein